MECARFRMEGAKNRMNGSNRYSSR
jgi:hypothetical protein